VSAALTAHHIGQPLFHGLGKKAAPEIPNVKPDIAEHRIIPLFFGALRTQVGLGCLPVYCLFDKSGRDIFSAVLTQHNESSFRSE
jgi:hypothetical protein